MVVIGQKHVTAELDRGSEMQGVGEPIPLRLSGRNCRVHVATPDSTGPDVHRGAQAQRPQVRPVEEPEKVLKELPVSWLKGEYQRFGAGQLADYEPMPGEFEGRQMADG